MVPLSLMDTSIPQYPIFSSCSIIFTRLDNGVSQIIRGIENRYERPSWFVPENKGFVLTGMRGNQSGPSIPRDKRRGSSESAE